MIVSLGHESITYRFDIHNAFYFASFLLFEKLGVAHLHKYALETELTRTKARISTRRPRAARNLHEIKRGALSTLSLSLVVRRHRLISVSVFATPTRAVRARPNV
jgi:hypothetical protein